MKDIKYGEEARASILKGIKETAQAVIVTLGPRGRNVIIERPFAFPLSTKDGVTVAKEVSLKNKFENLGASLIKEVCSKANIMVGDGTTTTAALTYALIDEGNRYIMMGFTPNEIKKGLEDSLEIVLEILDGQKRDITSREDILHVATISANNDKEIGEVIASAFDKLGPEGIITTADSKSYKTYVEFLEGMQFDKGYLSSYFVNTPKGTFESEDLNILILDYEIKDAQEILSVVQSIINLKKDLLIIVPEISADIITSLAIINHNLPKHKVCVIKSPGFGDKGKDLLKDISILVGGKVVSKDFGNKLEDFAPEWLGRANKVKVTNHDTLIFEGRGNSEEIDNRISEIRSLLEEETSDFLKEGLQERIAKMRGGIAIIKVGGMTEMELKEKKQRFEDALSATRAAITDGILPGGGIPLMKIGESLKTPTIKSLSFQAGYKIMKKALQFPFRKIVENTSESPDIIKHNILQKKHKPFLGYDALNEVYGDMYELGIIDPAAVTKSAITLAVSVAGLALTTECAIIDESHIKVRENDPMAIGNF